MFDTPPGSHLKLKLGFHQTSLVSQKMPKPAIPVAFPLSTDDDHRELGKSCPFFLVPGQDVVECHARKHGRVLGCWACAQKLLQQLGRHFLQQNSASHELRAMLFCDQLVTKQPFKNTKVELTLSLLFAPLVMDSMQGEERVLDVPHWDC